MSEEDKAVMLAENQIQEPQSSHGSWELPCGWITEEGELLRTVLVTEFSGVEEDILAAEKVESRAKMEALLTNCTQSIGPIRNKEEIARIIQKLPVGDRVYLLLSIRRTTLGDEYPYVATCPSCGHKDLFVVDLNEFVYRPMKDPMKRVYEVTLTDGIEARWHIMTGDREARIANMPLQNRKNDKVTLSILARLELLGGKAAGVHQLKELSMLQRNELRDSFEENEGGVDTDTDFECAKCGHEWTKEVDVTQKGFFFPSAAQRSWKRKSTS